MVIKESLQPYLQLLKNDISFWPTEEGITVDNSEILSNTVRDIAFNEDDGVAYIATRLPVELMWKSTFNQEQSFIRTIQKYDGYSYDRSIQVTCDVRKASDDMSIDVNRCQCQRAYGVYPPFNKLKWSSETYDPFCDQPTLQSNVFNNIESVVKLSARAFSSKYFANSLSTTVYNIITLSSVFDFVIILSI